MDRITAIINASLELLEPPVRLSSADWSEQNITLTSSVSSRTGRLRLYPWQRAACDFADSPDVSSLVLMWPSQALGKTLVLQSILGHSIVQNPAPSLILQPTVDMSESFAKTKFFPVINATPELKGLIKLEADNRLQGQGANSVLTTRFPGGFCVIGSAGSEASLRSFSCKLLLFDEVSLYDPSAGTGGDPITLALRRSETFADSKSIYASTPAINPGCRISMEYEDSSKHRWTCTCPNCALPWVFAWADVRWDKSVGKDGKTVHEVRGTWMQCPHCQSRYNDKARVQMALSGSFVAERPEITHKIGLHASALITPLPARKGFGGSKMAEFADEFLKSSKRGSFYMRGFKNTILAEAYEVEEEKDIPIETLLNRRETYPTFEETGEPILHERAGLITAAIDIQQSRLEMEIVAHGANNETWGLLYHVERGNPDLPATWENLKQLLLKQYRHPSGRLLTVYLVFVDCAYKPDAAYRFARRGGLYNVMCTRGTSGYAPAGQMSVSKSVGNNERMLLIRVDGVKNSLYDLLQVEQPGSGYQHFPLNHELGYDEYYFSTLLSEKVKLNASGRPTWVKKASQSRNEGWDLRVYNMAACEFANPNWAAVEKTHAQAVANPWNEPKGGTVREYTIKAPAPNAPISLLDMPKPQPRRQPKSGFVSSLFEN